MRRVLCGTLPLLMWAATIVAAPAGTLPACESQRLDQNANPGAGVIDGTPLLSGPYPLWSSGTIHCFVDERNVRHRYEVGSVDGLPYRVWYGNANAAIGARADVRFEFPFVRNESLPHTWRVRCRHDDFEEKTACRVNTYAIGILRAVNGQPKMRPVLPRYRHEQRWGIRPAGNKAVMSDENGRMTQAQFDTLIAQFKSSDSARIRYTDAQTSKAEATLNLEGFTAAWAVLTLIYDRLENGD